MPPAVKIRWRDDVPKYPMIHPVRVKTPRAPLLCGSSEFLIADTKSPTPADVNPTEKAVRREQNSSSSVSVKRRVERGDVETEGERGGRVRGEEDVFKKSKSVQVSAQDDFSRDGPGAMTDVGVYGLMARGTKGGRNGRGGRVTSRFGRGT